MKLREDEKENYTKLLEEYRYLQAQCNTLVAENARLEERCRSYYNLNCLLDSLDRDYQVHKEKGW